MNTGFSLSTKGEYRMNPWSIDYHGRYVEVTFESEVLKDNPLGDPSRRPLWVYLPPGYDQEPARRYPTIYQIQGLTGQLDMWRNRLSFRKNFPASLPAVCPCPAGPLPGLVREVLGRLPQSTGFLEGK